jgi:hypothetical protein
MGNREFMWEDFFNGPNGKPVFHANAVLAQISYEVQAPGKKSGRMDNFCPYPATFSNYFFQQLEKILKFKEKNCLSSGT